MKPKRCQEWIQFSRTEGICVGAYGHAVLEECRGYMKKDCSCYWHVTDKDVIKVRINRREMKQTLLDYVFEYYNDKDPDELKEVMAKYYELYPIEGEK